MSEARVEALRDEVDDLKEQIIQSQRGQKDQSLGQTFASKGGKPPAIRGPPTTKIRRTLKGHFGKVTALHWGGDSRLLVSASQDGNLLVWNAMTSNKMQAISLKSSYVMAVGIEQSKGDMVACGGLDNLCTVYRRSAPDKAMELASHEGFLSCCRFLDEQKILTSSGDTTCILFDIAKGQPISTFAEHTGDAMYLSLKPGDRSTFVSCSVDQTVKIWDIRTPKKSVKTIPGPGGDINCIDFMPSDGSCYAICTQDSCVAVYDIRAMNELARFGNNPNPAGSITEVGGDVMTGLSFSKSGRLIFVGHSDGSVLAFDTLSDRMTPAFTLSAAHEKHVSCVGVSPQGDALCTGSWDTNLKIWA